MSDEQYIAILERRVDELLDDVAALRKQILAVRNWLDLEHLQRAAHKALLEKGDEC